MPPGPRREPAPEYPRFPSHLWPRTTVGRAFVVAFLALFAFTEPPLLFLLGNRIEPRLAGLPFLYVYLLVLYALLVALLVWARRRGL